MHAFVGQDATSIVLGESIGGLTDIVFRRGSEARSKYFSAWPLGGLLLLGGGLEPPRLSAYAPQTYVSAISPPERFEGTQLVSRTTGPASVSSPEGKRGCVFVE
jgi:hypothetical protein